MRSRGRSGSSPIGTVPHRRKARGMTSLTRWVLAHKRIVVVVLGRPDDRGHRRRRARPREALDRSSRSRARRAGRPTRRSPSATTAPAATRSPLRPVVTLPAGKTRRLARRARASCARSKRTLAQALPGARVAGYASTGDTRLRLARTGARRSRSPTRRRDPDQPFGDNPKAREGGDARRSRGATVGGAPVHLTGFDALPGSERRQATARACCSRRCSAASARCSCSRFVFALVPGVRADPDGDRLDHDHVPAAARA